MLKIMNQRQEEADSITGVRHLPLLHAAYSLLLPPPFPDIRLSVYSN